LIKIGIWGAAVILVYTTVIGYHAGPRTDYFYNRFTQPKAPSLILGSSRAAQGIVPDSIDEEELLNYSFTNYNSPYGECYFNAAKKKFSGESGGIFILEVNPFVLSNYKRNMNGESEVFEECNAPPSNMWFTDASPNFEYFIRNYSEDLNTLTGIKERPFSIFLHDNGWLEIEMSFDTAYFRKNTEDKVRNYEELITKMKPSSARWDALAAIIEYFSRYGTVALVRIPVSPQMAEIESTYYADFGEQIKALSRKTETEYLDYSYLNDSLYFTDGNHLHRSSAKIFSGILSSDIQKMR
jgi:hypothetical protein